MVAPNAASAIDSSAARSVVHRAATKTAAKSSAKGMRSMSGHVKRVTAMAVPTAPTAMAYWGRSSHVHDRTLGASFCWGSSVDANGRCRRRSVFEPIVPGRAAFRTEVILVGIGHAHLSGCATPAASQNHDRLWVEPTRVLIAPELKFASRRWVSAVHNCTDLCVSA